MSLLYSEVVGSTTIIQVFDRLHSCELTDCVALFCSQYRFLSQWCCEQAGKICPIVRLQVNVNITSAAHCICERTCVRVSQHTQDTLTSMFSLPPFLQLITSPSEENSMYVQQRDEYLESVCEMAIRKVSIITIFGSLTNSTMKIDHYQIGKLFHMQYERVQYVFVFFAPCFDMVYATIAINCSKSFSCSARHLF